MKQNCIRGGQQLKIVSIRKAYARHMPQHVNNSIADLLVQIFQIDSRRTLPFQIYVSPAEITIIWPSLASVYSDQLFQSLSNVLKFSFHLSRKRKAFVGTTIIKVMLYHFIITLYMSQPSRGGFFTSYQTYLSLATRALSYIHQRHDLPLFQFLIPNLQPLSSSEQISFPGVKLYAQHRSPVPAT